MPFEPASRIGAMAGDPFDDAFRRLFDEQFRSLFRYLDRLTGDPALAADLAQEAFMRLYRRRSLPLDARAWLVSVAANLFRDERRAVARRRRLLGARFATPALEVVEPVAEHDVVAGERRGLVRKALSSLPQRDRQALLLRYEGYSYAEIAKALDLPASSIGTLLARAKRAFQAAFQDIPDASD
jgi:RNA polymerase sigma-70 factor (ECF subfamily)